MNYETQNPPPTLPPPLLRSEVQSPRPGRPLLKQMEQSEQVKRSPPASRDNSFFRIHLRDGTAAALFSMSTVLYRPLIPLSLRRRRRQCQMSKSYKSRNQVVLPHGRAPIPLQGVKVLIRLQGESPVDCRSRNSFLIWLPRQVRRK